MTTKQSAGKASTPVASPQMEQSSTMGEQPTTPHRESKEKLFSGFLRTPDHQEDHLKQSPSHKRSSTGAFKSPDYKLNAQSSGSPYSTLKTPKHSGYDSDDSAKGTPRFFSPAKKLFSEEPANKGELSEISVQLKSKLSSALGKLRQQKEEPTPNRVDFTDLTFNTTSSPTKKSRPSSEILSGPAANLQANLNLQTLQRSPGPAASPSFRNSGVFSQSPSKQHSPFFGHDSVESFKMAPLDIEESSAHNALVAALSRQRRKSRSSFSHSRRPSLPSLGPQEDHILHKRQTPTGSQQELPDRSQQVPQRKSLPPMPQDIQKPGNEQEAVLSLMSLSSAQSVKPSHSRHHSSELHSPLSPKSPTSNLAGPQKRTTPKDTPILPPISGLMNATAPQTNRSYDNEETDIEEGSTEEDS